MPAICKADLPLDSFGRRYHHGGPGPPGFKYDIHVGTRLKIYWPKTREFYPGTITAVNPKGMYVFCYDDGEVEKVKLGTLVWDFEELMVERRLKSCKISADQVGETRGGLMLKSSSRRVGGASKAEGADSGSKVDGDGGQIRQPSGFVAEVLQSSYNEDFGMDNRKDTDVSQKDTVQGGGLSRKRMKSEVDDFMSCRTAEAGGFLPANNPLGRGDTLRRVRRPSPVVRDLLGGNMVGGCGLDSFALAAANLLAPPKEAATAEGAFFMPGEAEQLRGQQRRRSQQPPTTELRAPTAAPLFSPLISTLGPRMELEEGSCPC